MKCDFIGIGVQKSASTWVYKILEDHPEVIVSFPKELDYFSRDETFAKGEDWYHSHFTPKLTLPEQVLHGEISPSYFHSDKAPERAFEYNNELKIIVTLRDPVDRAFSNHLHMIRRGKFLEGDSSFETGLAKFPQYCLQSNYYTHLKKWYETFPRENILVLLQEEIQEHPLVIAQQVYKFLGINPSFASNNLYRKANQSSVIKYRKLEMTLRFLSLFALKLGFNKIVKMVKSNPIVIKLRNKNSVHLESEIEQIDSKTKIQLMDQFSDEVESLAELLKRESFPWDSWRHIDSKKEDNI